MVANSRARGIEVHAPAKLNLFFEVLSKRVDGFHEIETLMVPISLYDTLYFSDRPPAVDGEVGQIEFGYRWASDVRGRAAIGQASMEREIPEGADNIVVKAINLLRRVSGTDRGATIHLIKRIPPAAGLGGGSSDAAAALLAANRAWKLGWSRDRLASLAAQLGSDVPFFLARGPAVCRGRGEIIEPIAGLGDISAVVVHPPAGLSTGAVYGACEIPEVPRRVEPLLEAFRRGHVGGAAKHIHNRLQPTAARLSPWIERLAARFDQMSFPGHQMTGSGTSYFGICHHVRHARRLAMFLHGTTPCCVFPVRRARQIE